jgi:plastocyanin
MYASSDRNAVSAPKKEAATHSVAIDGMQFRPVQLTVGTGDWIVFSNKDLFPHTVTADGKSFDSHAIAANAEWRFRAGQPGVYPYHCTFHPTMNGTITVR